MIPYQLHQGSIALPGATKEEALRKYQTAVTTACAAGKPLAASMQEFVDSATPPPPVSSGGNEES
jgi:hypothetical protein